MIVRTMFNTSSLRDWDTWLHSSSATCRVLGLPWSVARCLQALSAMENAIEGKDFNFAEQEKDILEFWTKIDAFKQQLKRTEGCKEYVFFDGPPFATGLPHYGHILAGTIKV